MREDQVRAGWKLGRGSIPLVRAKPLYPSAPQALPAATAAWLLCPCMHPNTVVPRTLRKWEALGDIPLKTGHHLSSRLQQPFCAWEGESPKLSFQSRTSNAVCLQPLVALLEDVLAVGCLLLHIHVVISNSAKQDSAGIRSESGPWPLHHPVAHPSAASGGRCSSGGAHGSWPLETAMEQVGERHLHPMLAKG